MSKQLWSWRFKQYSKERLSEIVRASKPGEESDHDLAAFEELARRKKESAAV